MTSKTSWASAEAPFPRKARRGSALARCTSCRESGSHPSCRLDSSCSSGALAWHRRGSTIASAGAFARRLQARSPARCRSRFEVVVSLARIQSLSVFVRSRRLGRAAGSSQTLKFLADRVSARGQHHEVATLANSLSAESEGVAATRSDRPRPRPARSPVPSARRLRYAVGLVRAPSAPVAVGAISVCASRVIVSRVWRSERPP